MLYLVRHGRTAANAAGQLLGHLDPALDPLGVTQARAVADVLPPGARVVCSPLQRTRETAAALGRPVTVDERWIELDYGDWDGRPLAEVTRNEWSAWRSDDDYAPPGGESLRMLGQRVRAACADLVAEATEGDVVVVSHVSPIKAAVAWALDAPDGVAWRLFVAPASISRLRVSGPMPAVASFNETAHLAPLQTG